ncbi:MAG: T9SS type A sorting domain-containing protein [Candidatus Cloacimonetes bacterium]|nr:T9SS type A sorting domain-containing protein [Candidatus Cloacimonadota bacterium]
MKKIFIVLLLAPLALSAAYIYVAADSTQDYTRIQDAVLAASNGDTILVFPDRYYENIHISDKKLMIASLEYTTGNSDYIAETVIDANQSGGCFHIDMDSEVTLHGLYLTNGSGCSAMVPGPAQGGAIFGGNSKINIVNCRIIGNRAPEGAGVYFYQSDVYLSGTEITENWGHYYGGLMFRSITIPAYTLTFDPVNRCSIYNNHSSHINDICLNIWQSALIDIYLDKFTVALDSNYFKECFGLYPPPEYPPIVNFFYNSTVLQQEASELYVSPSGDDENSGLSADAPLKSIAQAIHRLAASPDIPGTIHLANGVYGAEQNFPLNLRSYMQIIGESEAGVIFEPNGSCFRGYDSEKEVLLKNISFRGMIFNVSHSEKIIDCSSFNKIDGVLDKLSLQLENLTFQDIHPQIYFESYLYLVWMFRPESLVLRNITVQNCEYSSAFFLNGDGIFADRILIDNNVNTGNRALAGIAISKYPDTSGGVLQDNIFQNLRITNCHSNPASSVSMIQIYAPYATEVSRNYFINCTLADNFGNSEANAVVRLSSPAKATFINSIITDATRPAFRLIDAENGQQTHLEILHCLLGTDGNLNAQVIIEGQENSVDWYGTNLSCDPLFYPWNADNHYILGEFSPCIDAGTLDFSNITMPDGFEYATYDLAGNPRVYGNAVDLGAYEWQGAAGIDSPEAQARFNLANYPNPFNPQTNLKFEVPQSGRVRLSIYNLKGQKIRDLIDRQMTAGMYTEIWDGCDANHNKQSSGIYLFKLEAGGNTLIRKAIMMK